MEENGKEGPPVFLDGLDELDRKIVRLLIGNARISYSDLGAQVSCYFEIETRPETLAEVAALLEGNETVTQIYRVTGKSKLHVHAVAASAGEMEQLMTGVIDRLPGVVCCDCNMILSRIKDIKGLRL